MTRELAGEDRLHERAEQQAVLGADEVDRRAHHDGANDAPIDDQVRELLRPEALQARPERRVRVQRYLRLQANEVLDHLEHRSARAAQQVLALECGPVQSPQAEHVAAHGAIVARGAIASLPCRKAWAPVGSGIRSRRWGRSMVTSWS